MGEEITDPTLIDPSKWYCLLTDSFDWPDCETGDFIVRSQCCLKGDAIILWFQFGLNCHWAQVLCFVGFNVAQNLVSITGPYDDNTCNGECPPV